MELLTFLNIICASTICIIFSTAKSEKLTFSIPTILASPAIHSIFCHLQTPFAYFLSFAICLLPFFWIPIYIYRSLVILIARVTKPDFGNIFKPGDAVFVEDCLFKEGPRPMCALVNSVTLDSPIGIEELRRLFDKNVIRRAYMNSIRYPELRQFPTKFMGYIFWKHDNQFKLEDHVIEEHYKDQDLSLIHQKMLNKPFAPYKSPWEIVLISGGEKTLIIGRFHHSLVDAKSIIKLFVECLGNQELTAPQPQKIEFGVVDKLLMPLRFIPIMAGELNKILSLRNHPWRFNRTKLEESYGLPQVLKFSAKLSLSDIKKIGNTIGGTASSVILAIISGSMSKVRPDLGNMSCIYILPKENHPPTLGNHADCAFVILPTSDPTSKKLETCNQMFKEIKQSNIDICMRLVPYMVGTTFYPLMKMIFNDISLCLAGITNIAGESKGFSIGGRECSDFAFSVGTLRGDIAGTCFCVSSYKDHIQIAVLSKGGRLTENELEKLADGMSKELEYLKRIASE